jgi:hypothetical protein
VLMRDHVWWFPSLSCYFAIGTPPSFTRLSLRL